MSELQNGKGDSYRIPITDKQYKENYDKIFRKEENELNRQY